MKMNRIHHWMLSGALLIGFVTTSAFAGQIVTPEMKQWARNALQQEKKLATTSRENAIAVLYFQNLSGHPELDPIQKGLTVMLISDLSRLEMFTIIERTELQALIEELGLGQSGLVEPGSEPRIGRLLQARRLIGGTFLKDPAHPLNIDATILDVAPEKILQMEGTKGTLQSLLDLEKQLLFQFIAALKIELSPAQKESLNKPLTRNPAALLAFFKGIDAGDHGRYQEAAGHYSQALSLDPQLALADESLKELNTLGLLKNTPHKRRMLRQMRQETSFSTTLNPPLPLSRIPQPAGVRTNETRINQDFIDTPPVRGNPRGLDAQPNNSTSPAGQ